MKPPVLWPKKPIYFTSAVSQVLDTGPPRVDPPERPERPAPPGGLTWAEKVQLQPEEGRNEPFSESNRLVRTLYKVL